MEKIWLKHYPAGVPAELKTDRYTSLVALLEQAFLEHGERVAYKFMGRDYSFARIDEAARALAAYLQSVGLERGDRIALMMPNLPQYPVAVAAVLRAGCVVVNVNPLYTPRELAHQLKDSGARAIVILENFAAALQQVLDAVPARQVILVSMGDMLGGLRGAVVNHMVRNVRKLVPSFELAGAVRFNDALSLGRTTTYIEPLVGADDIAVLQYPGGTTGVSKGAVLLHRNLVANLLQTEAWNEPALRKIPAGEQPTTVCALPLDHIFGFTASMLLSLHIGACNILIPNPRDISALLKDLSKHRFHTFPAADTTFNAMALHPACTSVDWSHLVLAVGGGMAVQQGTARLWLEKTGCPICEGYGLSEASPAVTCNPVDSTAFSGDIGLPLPNTELALLDDAGQEVAQGMAGEIAIRGPQVMGGYWQRPDETAKVMTRGGFLRTGDIGVVDEHGHFRIIGRKKDMIVVSGSNVYPTEIEDLIGTLPGVLECAAVGMPDARAGEAVKLVVVKKDPSLSEADIRSFCEANLTGYKRPQYIEFRGELPKSTIGKILRHELRELKA
ncbi:MAG TPA: AMP-binding protein [Rubrivivax sp.]|nr:AMP-binding protein [Rubrivivax sp.]